MQRAMGGERQRQKGETEMDMGGKILIVAGGKLIRPTVFHFCVEKSRHIDSSQRKRQE